MTNGELLAAWHEPRHRVDQEQGRDMTAWSADGGRTWSDPIVAVDVAGIDDRDPVIRLGRNGRIWLGAAGGFAVTSSDHGRTWSAPLKAGGYPVGVLADGEFLWTCWGGFPEGYPERRRQFAYVRGTRVLRAVTDGTLEWDRQQLHFGLGDGDEWYLCETAVPGRLVALLRQQDTGDYYYTSISEDGGASFRDAVPSSIWHSPTQSRPMLMRMTDGTIVCSYGERQNNRIMLIASFDHGRTWATHRKLVVCDNRGLMNSDHSYPDTAQIDGQTLVSAWYARDKVYVNQVDARFFRDVYAGLRLADSAPVFAERTIARWNFNEADGIVAGDPARHNYGKIAYAERTEGRFGRGLRFDGSRAFVQVIDSDTVRVPHCYTLAAWIRTEDAARPQTILDKGDPYYLGLEQARLTFRTAELRYQSKSEIPPGRWTHVAAVTWVANHYLYVSLFIDGKLDAKHKIPGAQNYWQAQRRNDRRIGGGPLYQEYYPTLNQRLDALILGNGQGPDRAGFLGTLDEVRIYEGSLTDAEIMELASAAHSPRGQVVSAPITRPPNTAWAAFHAEIETPPGTGVLFSVLDTAGTAVLADLGPDADLAGLEPACIRLRADLETADPSRTPLLRSWTVTWE